MCCTFHLSCFSQRTHLTNAWARGHLLIWNGLFCIINGIFSSERDSTTFENCVAAQDTASIAAPHVQKMQTCLGAHPENSVVSWGHLGYNPMEWTRKVHSCARWMAVVQSGCQGSWVHRERRLHAGRRSWESEDRMQEMENVPEPLSGSLALNYVEQILQNLSCFGELC